MDENFTHVREIVNVVRTVLLQCVSKVKQFDINNKTYTIAISTLVVSTSNVIPGVMVLIQ